ncbi:MULTISPECIES: DUF2513 domain-containing protein [Calothrix]|uniref:DUF2513 domain-containing protein n=2 Tax=Calothrix TaxID=1186 RepID=A0ABR8A9H7_9CYAN|nr:MULTISPECIES: DUF2513 domain-containing protein [Calothrix]MBD2196641.1 DUF2513 domain-containing protein [Calothrix parietina FACHB-288]MBD2224262.1 DUF2513 domain-containing protein [Calothrix anomala FACHB-343]
MKQDLELIRKIILLIEDSAHGFAPTVIKIENYSQEQIDYHAYLIIDAGLAVGNITTNTLSQSPQAVLRNLTSSGHDFAVTARSETMWKKAMDTVKEKGGTITVGVLIQLLATIVKTHYGLS